ncbi:MAG: ATP-binding protein [Crenarchaeota archaeon]|nr:ATP-binding protein [Thermoproteota archaeon]
MKVDYLKKVVASQREEMESLFAAEKIIERDVDAEKLRSFLSQPNILTVLGVRRCGKSLLSWMLLRGLKFGYVNFFDERLAGFEAKNLGNLLEAFYQLYGTDLEYMVLDEIQHVNGWERFVSRMRTSKKIIVTGSSSQLLSSELATLLTGRHVDFVLYPFNFREFLRIRGVELGENWQYSTIVISKLKSMLEEYLKTGGFPEASKFGRRILVSIYSDVLEKDVASRHRVKKTVALKEFVRYMVSNVSSEFSFSRLRRILNIKDVHTVKNYAEWVSEAYLLFFLERFSPKLKLQFISPKKAYCVDNGIVTSIGFRVSENLGGLMENLVAVELLRRRSYSFSDFEVFYWRDYQHNEVDFIVKNGLNIKQLIQVTYATGRDEVNPREVKALLKASGELRCKDLLVVTWDYEDEAVSNGRKIRYIPLWKWLLNP